MSSRRYPQLLTHNNTGRLLAQPLWLAPKLHRYGEVLDVYGAPRSANQHRLLLQSRQHQNTRAGNRINPMRSGKRPVGVSTPLRRSVGNRGGRNLRGSARSRKNNATRTASRSNPQGSVRVIQGQSELIQGFRTEGSVNRLSSSVSAPARTLPGRASGTANYNFTTQPQYSASSMFKHLSSSQGTVERPPLGVPEPNYSPPGIPSSNMNSVIANQLQENSAAQVVTCSKRQAQPRISEEVSTVEAEFEMPPFGASAPPCSPASGGEPGIIPMPVSQSNNTLAQGPNFQTPTLSRGIQTNEGISYTPTVGISLPQRNNVPREEQAVPVNMTQTMNNMSVPLSRCSNTLTTASHCLRELKPSEGRAARSSTYVPTPTEHVLPASKYGQNPVSVSQAFVCVSTTLNEPTNPQEVTGALQGHASFLHTGRTQPLDQRISLDASMRQPGSVLGGVPHSVNRVDLTQQMNILSRNLMQESGIQASSHQSQVQGDYFQGASVAIPAVQTSPSIVSNALGTQVGVHFYHGDGGVEGQITNAAALSPVVNLVETNGLHANDVPTSNPSPPFSEISESINDLPILPDMEELVQEEDELMPNGFADLTEVMEPLFDTGVSERDSEREREILEELEAMLHGGNDTTVPFDEESLNILNSFSSPMETMEAGGDVISPQYRLEGAQEPSVEEQMSRIVGLDHELMNEPDDEAMRPGVSIVLEDRNGSCLRSPILPENMERASDNDVIDGAVTHPTDGSVCDPVVPVPVDEEVLECVTVANGVVMANAESTVPADRQQTDHGVPSRFTAHPESAIKAFTRNDYARLQKALRLHGAYNRAELMKLFPDRSYEELLQRIRYYFPGAVHQKWEEEEHRRLFDIIGRVVDWECVAGRMSGRDADEVRRYYYGLLRR